MQPKQKQTGIVGKEEGKSGAGDGDGGEVESGAQDGCKNNFFCVGTSQLCWSREGAAASFLPVCVVCVSCFVCGRCSMQSCRGGRGQRRQATCASLCSLPAVTAFLPPGSAQLLCAPAVFGDRGPREMMH